MRPVEGGGCAILASSADLELLCRDESDFREIVGLEYLNDWLGVGAVPT